MGKQQLFLMPVTRTNKGYELIKFFDYYGTPCKLQQSSLALYMEPGSSAIWLGPEEDPMHLSFEQVAELVGVLTRWLETNSFEVKRGNDD